MTTRYQHTKGVITDNAIQALLHDPLFKQRVEKIAKVKAAIAVKLNMAKRQLGGCRQTALMMMYFTYSLLFSIRNKKPLY